MVQAEGRGGGPRLGGALLRAAAGGGRLAVRQVDQADPVTLLDELGERPAAADLGVVRVRPDGDHVERFGQVGGQRGRRGLWGEPGRRHATVTVPAPSPPPGAHSPQTAAGSGAKYSANRSADRFSPAA